MTRLIIVSCLFYLMEWSSVIAQASERPTLPSLLDRGYKVIASAGFQEENNSMQLIVTKRSSYYICFVRGANSACNEMEE